MRRRQPRLLFNDPGLILSKALTLGCFTQADLVGRCAIRGISSGAFYSLDTTRLTPFILRLFGDWRSSTLPTLVPSDEYQFLLECWKSEDSALVERALLNACDFHTERSEEHTSSETFEFRDFVYRIYPVEVLSVLRLREQLGLTVPKIHHPLMDSPLGELYDIKELTQDPLLDRLTDKLKTEMPSLRLLTDQS